MLQLCRKYENQKQYNYIVINTITKDNSIDSWYYSIVENFQLFGQVIFTISQFNFHIISKLDPLKFSPNKGLQQRGAIVIVETL